MKIIVEKDLGERITHFICSNFDEYQRIRQIKRSPNSTVWECLEDLVFSIIVPDSE